MAEQTSHSGARPFQHFGRKIDEKLGQAGPRVEQDLRRIITYLNDEVVPDVRRSSSIALRSAAQQLTRLAERLEHRPAAPVEDPAAGSAPGAP